MNNNLPVNEIFNFWFQTLTPIQWFTKDPEIDAQIKQKFEKIVENAQNQKYDTEILNDHEKLALIIVLDQFSRNIYRDSQKAFAGDTQALKLTKIILEKNGNQNFNENEKTFLYMPLEHSENLEDQNLCVKLFEEIGNENYTHYAKLHQQIIKQFGRFPHRNQILNRQSTNEEKIFLTQPNSSF